MTLTQTLKKAAISLTKPLALSLCACVVMPSFARAASQTPHLSLGVVQAIIDSTPTIEETRTGQRILDGSRQAMKHAETYNCIGARDQINSAIRTLDDAFAQGPFIPPKASMEERAIRIVIAQGQDAALSYYAFHALDRVDQYCGDSADRASEKTKQTVNTVLAYTEKGDFQKAAALVPSLIKSTQSVNPGPKSALIIRLGSPDYRAVMKACGRIMHDLFKEQGANWWRPMEQATRDPGIVGANANALLPKPPQP